MPNKLNDTRGGGETPSGTPTPVTSADVALYLAEHPDFLDRHPELLSVLTPPAGRRGDNVVDMQAFMLARLQAESLRLKGQQKALIATSRSNLTSQSRIHMAVLAAMSAVSLEQLVHVVTAEFAMILDIDVVTLCLETDGPPPENRRFPGVQILDGGAIDRLIGDSREAGLAQNIAGVAELFGAGAGLVHSQALLRLTVGPKSYPALLALGSRRPTRFRAGQGTELLCFLARSVQLALAARLAAGT